MPAIVSTEWIRAYAPSDLSAAEMADRLSSLGLAVDDLEMLDATDARLELDLTANRGDCWSMIGVAREMAAATGCGFTPPETTFEEAGDPIDAGFSVSVADEAGCPRYTARLVRGVKIGPSPEWMQRRLESVGIRPISNVVDVTNYVMVEMGQPLHAFDLALLAGRQIIVRRAKKDEKIALIDGSEKTLSEQDLVIADGQRPVALAGVMGGADTEIRESTQDVLLESAQFDIISIRRTSRVHGVKTDSSIRFEHGVDPVGVEAASRRAAHLLAKVSGGTVAPGVIDSNPDVWTPREVTMRHSQLPRILGADVPQLEAIRILESLGLTLVGEDGETTRWQVPSWRQDISIEVDLIEEVARVYGYERLGGASTMRVFPVVAHEAFEARRTVRDVLTSIGYTEAVGASFFTGDHATFGPSEFSAEAAYRVKNPVRAEEGYLRTSVMPSLLAAKLANQNRGRRRVRLFEAAPVCVPGVDEPRQRLGIIDDGIEGDEYGGVAADSGAERVFLRAKGAIESVVARLVPEARLTLSDELNVDGLESARAIRVGDGQMLGYAGILAAKTAADLDIKSQPAIVELDLEMLASLASGMREAKPLDVFPGISRDVALVLDEGTRWAEIESLVHSKKLAHEWRRTETLKLVSVFRGKQLGAGRKSIAFRLVYRADDRTLTDDDIKVPHEEFVAALCSALKAEVRG